MIHFPHLQVPSQTPLNYFTSRNSNDYSTIHLNDRIRLADGKSHPRFSLQSLRTRLYM